MEVEESKLEYEDEQFGQQSMPGRFRAGFSGDRSSLILLILGLLLALGLIAGSLLLSTSSKNPFDKLVSNTKPTPAPQPISFDSFTPVTDRAWGVTLSYDSSKKETKIKNIEIINSGIRDDLRGALSSVYVNILNAERKPIYSTNIPITKSYRIQLAEESRYITPASPNTYVYLPLFEKGKYLALYAGDKKIIEKELPQLKKEAAFAPQANAQSRRFNDDFRLWSL